MLNFCVRFLKKLFPSFQIAQSYQLFNELKILSSLVVWIVVEVNEFLTEVLFSLPLNICFSCLTAVLVLPDVDAP